MPPAVGKGLPVVRIDERLLHAQVLIGWVGQLGLDRIVVASAAAAGDPETGELFRLIVPEGLHLELLDEAGAARRLRDYPGDRGTVMVLLSSPAAALAYLQAGGNDGLTELHLGGIYHRPGRTKYRDGLYLDAAEAAVLQEIAAGGISVTYRPLPCTKPVPLAELLDRD